VIRRPSVIRAREYLDDPADPVLLEHSLDHVAAVNRWLGGTRALLRALAPRLPPAGELTILDVGTGSADVPLALVPWARRRDRSVRVVALDRHPQTVHVARRRTCSEPRITVVRGNALALPFADASFDFALLSLTLHHLDAAAQPAALRELARVARRALIVNELERSWPNYAGARLLAATLWRHNPITRHDGPVSVRQAFTADELLACARAAGLHNPRVQRRVFYRLVLIADAAAAVRTL
jgi:2-polyprenyl-3-methyl-5-hydroxy-6-metoxy-1,4-benzoquinol methylase